MPVSSSRLKKDIQGAAQWIVETCLRVREGDVLWIDAWDDMIQFVNSLELSCMKIGARPIVSLRDVESVEGILSTLSLENLKNYRDPLVDVVAKVNACVSIGGPADPSFLKRTDAARLAEYWRFRSGEIFDQLRGSRIPSAFPMLGIITQERAHLQKLGLDRFHAMMYGAMNVDYHKIAALVKRVSVKLAGADRVSVGSGNKKRLEFSVKGRSPYPNDGIIDEEDLSRGRSWVTLPPGSVSVAPLEDSAEGMIDFRGNFSFKGNLLRDVSFSFKGGRVIGMDARRGANVLRDYVVKAGGDSDRIGGFTVGLNHKQQRLGLPADSTAGGTVTVGIGLNSFIEGKNKGNFFYGFSVEKPDVFIDGEQLMKAGRMIGI